MAAQIPETHQDILHKKGFAHVATVGPKGEPQTSPVWYGWDGENILFSHTKARQKYKNLLRQPMVAISITDPDNPYRYVEVRGVATIEDDTDKTFIDEMAQKYLGKPYPWNQPGDERVIMKVKPSHVASMG